MAHDTAPLPKQGGEQGLNSSGSPSSPLLIDRSSSFWGLLLVVLIWKLFAGAQLGLIFDECYYWVWSLHLQACYFDHPPLVAWVIAAGHALLGHNTMAVRLGAILSGPLLAIAGRQLGKEMFGHAAGNRAGIFLTLAPIFAGNSFLTTPDTMLIPAWAFAMLFAWRGSRPGSPMAWWLASGASAGVGMLSKYTMVLFFAGLGFLWLVSPGKRRRLFLGGVMAGIVALIIFLPVIWWNSRHGWVSFAHQLNHGFHNEHRHLINFQNLADYAVFLVVLVSPVLGLLCFRTATSRMGDDHFRFLGCFFWPVVAFFGFSAAKAHIEANWPMAAFVSGLLMVAGDWERYGKAWRKAALFVLLIADLGAVIGISILLFPGAVTLPLRNSTPDMAFLVKITGSERIASSASRAVAELQARLSEILGPREVALKVAQSFRESGADFICTDTYQTYGVLVYHAPELEPYLTLPIRGRSRFPWSEDAKWKGATALVAEWPRSGCDFGWLFTTPSKPRKIFLPGITKPLTLSLHKGYDPSRITEP